jgi:hypothetical protein
MERVPSTPVDIWETQVPNNSIADRVFATTSTTGIELTNDYEPVVYQANRALLAANAAQELNELQERNHATTAYSTLNCVASPLFPTFAAQRAVKCAVDEAAGVGITPPPPGRVAEPWPPIGYPPNLPQIDSAGRPGYYQIGSRVGTARVDEDNGTDGTVADEDDADADEGATTRRNVSPSFPQRMCNSVRGALYDLKHWGQLPPATAGGSSGEVFQYVVSRDNRVGYLLLWIAIIVLLIALVGLAIGLGVKRKKRNAASKQVMMWNQFMAQHLQMQQQQHPHQRHYYR